MSGMDDRARQFKAAAELQPTGPTLKKEVNTLRRFLFRNQEHRFTKAAQQALYMAVLAHYGNPASHHASGYAPTAAPATITTTAEVTTTAGSSPPAHTAEGHYDHDEDAEENSSAAEAPVLRLLDDALKMPFTVFTSAQKDKLLGLYWTVLGTEGSPAGAAGGAAENVTTLTLSLVDIVEVSNNAAHLSLFTDEGEDYAQTVLVSEVATLKQLRRAFDEGNAVSVVVQENETGARFVSFTVDKED